MVVYGGTPVDDIGNEVQEGDPLIMPFVGDGEVKNPTVAFGEITAIVVREINLKYSSEEEFNAKSGSEIIDSIERIKSNLNNEEHFLTFQTTKKIVDKTIVCSIYYELVARIA